MVAKAMKATKKKAVAKDAGFTKKALKPKATPVDTGGKKQCRGMDIGRFYAFSQCSLKMEAKHFFNFDVKLTDPVAIQMWPHFEKMALRNLGKNEKWVPFHTVLGIHEHYVVKNIHHAAESKWDAYRRFLLMFMFRSHCKIELFERQLPFFRSEAFWKDPKAAFNKGSPMHKMMQTFRADGNAMQTSCFLIIPERLVKDDNENIILNCLLRTQRLLDLAEELWPILNDKKVSAEAKFEDMRERILKVRNAGETWVKMLTVVMDIAKPEFGLLQDRCEVGSGAADPLRKILEDEGILKPKVKKERDPDAKQATSQYQPFDFCGVNLEIVAVKKLGKQLSQVTVGAAGSADRAHAIAEELCRIANKGANKEQVESKKKALLADKSLKVKKLGLDAKRKVLLEKKAAAEPKEDRSGEPTPMEGLRTLRNRIVKASGSPSGKAFSKICAAVEQHAQQHYKKMPLFAKQFSMSKKGLSCVTLQVQLCEFRQFNNSLKDRAGTKRSADDS